MAQFTFVPTAEPPDIAEDIRVVFEELAAKLRHDQRAYSGEYEPAFDVLETDEAFEIVMDLCGVPKEAVRVLFRAGVVIIAGEKAPPPSGGSHTYHLVEREFGRFARAVRLTGAFDLDSSRASLVHGELTVVVRKLPDRRGRPHEIPVT